MRKGAIDGGQTDREDRSALVLARALASCCGIDAWNGLVDWPAIVVWCRGKCNE